MKESRDGFIGIDVGLTGAICILDENIKPEIHKMPTIKVENSSYKHWYDSNKIGNLLNNAKEKYSNVHVFLEYQRPIPGQRIDSVFRLGRGFGLLEGIASEIFSDIEIIDPKKWQHYLYKKFMTKEDLVLIEFGTDKVHLQMDKEYGDIFEKKRSLKATKLTKLRTFYCLYKSGIMDKIPKADLKDTDKVDSFMISYYGFLITNTGAKT